MTIATRLLEADLDYDGSQLSSLFAYRTIALQGDSLVAFVGACDVTTENMVDFEDLHAGARIFSPRMLHFICELFGETLPAMVLRQRLLARLAADLLGEMSGQAPTVRGDDVFVGDRKASISIATVSPVSALFHFAVNIDTQGVPVPAIGLAELGVAWRSFAETLLERYRAEHEDVRRAAAKVRWVR